MVNAASENKILAACGFVPHFRLKLLSGVEHLGISPRLELGSSMVLENVFQPVWSAVGGKRVAIKHSQSVIENAHVIRAGIRTEVAVFCVRGIAIELFGAGTPPYTIPTRAITSRLSEDDNLDHEKKVVKKLKHLSRDLCFLGPCFLQTHASLRLNSVRGASVIHPKAELRTATQAARSYKE